MLGRITVHQVVCRDFSGAAPDAAHALRLHARDATWNKLLDISRFVEQVMADVVVGREGGSKLAATDATRESQLRVGVCNFVAVSAQQLLCLLCNRRNTPLQELCLWMHRLFLTVNFHLDTIIATRHSPASCILPAEATKAWIKMVERMTETRKPPTFGLTVVSNPPTRTRRSRTSAC